MGKCQDAKNGLHETNGQYTYHSQNVIHKDGVNVLDDKKEGNT